jgi:hypothetical protein
VAFEAAVGEQRPDLKIEIDALGRRPRRALDQERHHQPQ